MIASFFPGGKMAEQRVVEPRGRPPHPGELLNRVLLRNYDLSPDQLAMRTGLDRERVNRLVQGKISLSIKDAEALRPIFGRASDGLLRAQQFFDFFEKHGRRPSFEERQELLSPRI